MAGHQAALRILAHLAPAAWQLPLYWGRQPGVGPVAVLLTGSLSQVLSLRRTLRSLRAHALLDWEDPEVKMYRGQRTYPRAGESQRSITVEEGWGGQRVAYPLRRSNRPGEPHAVAAEFDWGYQGLAPQELACSLLADCFGRKWAAHPDVSQSFMDEVIGALAKPGWELTERDLAEWAHGWALHHGERELAVLAEIMYVRLTAGDGAFVEPRTIERVVAGS